MVIKLACTCASLTPGPRFQGSSSLCPSLFNCYILRDTFHTLLFFSPFFSPSFSIFPLHSLFTVFIHSYSCSVFSPFTLLSFLHSSFFSSFLLPFFFPSS